MLSIPDATILFMTLSNGCRALEHFLGQKNRHEATQEKNLLLFQKKVNGQRKIKTNVIIPRRSTEVRENSRKEEMKEVCSGLGPGFYLHCRQPYSCSRQREIRTGIPVPIAYRTLLIALNFQAARNIWLLIQYLLFSIRYRSCINRNCSGC